MALASLDLPGVPAITAGLQVVLAGGGDHSLSGLGRVLPPSRLHPPRQHRRPSIDTQRVDLIVGAKIASDGKIRSQLVCRARNHKASAISKITDDPRVEISVCIDLLNAKEWLERYAGAEHLAFMGALAEPALPDLRRAMEEDEDDSVRGMAWLAMEQIEQSS